MTKPRKLPGRKRRHSNGTRHRIALIQTLVMLSLSLMNQKIICADASNNLEYQQNNVKSSPATVEERYSGNTEATDTPQRKFEAPDANEETKNSGVFVVHAIDGSMAGLSKTTGKLIWKRSGNPITSDPMRSRPEATASDATSVPLLDPLLSTTTTARAPSKDWKTAAIPSMDGSVYLTTVSASSEDVTVTTTVAELVARSPFVDKLGRIYNGSQRSTIVAMDADTGEVLHTVPTGTRDVNQFASRPDWKGRNIVWVGRIDQQVAVYETKSASIDVEFRSSKIQSVHDMLLSDDQDHPWADDYHLLAGRSESGSRISGHEFFSTGSVSPVQEDSSLVVTPGGNVALRSLETGEVIWVSEEVFESPVAFCVDSETGISVGIDVVSDVAAPRGSAEDLSWEIQRQIELAETAVDEKGSPSSEQTLVGSLKGNGQLFAMPLGVRKRNAVWKDPNRKGTLTSIGASTGTTASSHQAKKHSVAVSSLPVGPNSGLHHEKAQVLGMKKPCGPGMAEFPSCLVGSARILDPFAQNIFFSPQSEEDHSLVPRYEFHDHFNRIHELNHYQRQQSWKYLKVLSSYLIPTIVTLFVVSFEMGRRKRQRDKDKQEKSMDAAAGVIQVQEEVILGYGGHGTVVYKGTLEGRQVAVKRMLKAYHASADREISLLIESDGHQNVVRYFLKEVRGDFVYLALELCDLSLHDLIGSLHTHIEYHPTLPETFAKSTKAILSQIANGVKHLHRLRIVHRDLKPANILLADLKKLKRKPEETDVLLFFEKGDYVAKISDMGLGKQLMGQSSYGASALGETSSRGHSHGGQSSNAGPGPGSVGWQAPEVMAKRASSDASVRSDGSGPVFASESFPEISPKDFAAGSRTSRSVDVFSLGCIFYSLLIPGSHPFGEWYEREANIMHNRPNMEALRRMSADAYDLVQCMIHRNPLARPTALQVCEHHFFWSASKRLAFLCDFSDRLETDAIGYEDKKSMSLSSSILSVEKNAAEVVGVAWDSYLDDALVSNVQRFRTYDPSSVRDLLRLIRNKHHHFDELPDHLKNSIGTNTDGLSTYFELKFPALLNHCVSLCRDSLPAGDSLAAKYSLAPIGRLSVGVAVVREKEELVVARDLLDEAIIQGTEQSLCEPTSEDQITPGNSGLAPIAEATVGEDTIDHAENVVHDTEGIVIWEGSTAATALNCRGWSRSDDEWRRCTDVSLRKRDATLKRCAEDPKFRTRLCNHWDHSLGTFCPMRKKGKCVFAHGPVELRVKEAKKGRWGTLVDPQGDNKNPNHSGGEDTYGAARSIEVERKQEGKWNTNGGSQTKDKRQPNKRKKAGPKVSNT